MATHPLEPQLVPAGTDWPSRAANSACDHAVPSPLVAPTEASYVNAQRRNLGQRANTFPMRLLKFKFTGASSPGGCCRCGHKEGPA